MTTSRPTEQVQDTKGPGPAQPRRLGRTVALVVILSIFWLLLSGRIGLQYFLFMAASVGLVVWMNPERPFRRVPGSDDRGIGGYLKGTVGLVRYLVWLVWNVMKANVDVAYRILAPSMPIRPRLMVFTVDMESEVARAVVANSITLTPGTVTIDVEGNSYLVHALHPDASEAVTGGALQNAVSPIFDEGPQQVPEIRWGNSAVEVLHEGSGALPLTDAMKKARAEEIAP